MSYLPLILVCHHNFCGHPTWQWRFRYSVDMWVPEGICTAWLLLLGRHRNSHIIMVLSFLASTLCPSLTWRNRVILFLPILSHHLQDQSTPGQSILNKALKVRGAPILPSCSAGSIYNGISTTVFSSSIIQRLQPLSYSSHFVASCWSSSTRGTESKSQDNTQANGRTSDNLVSWI